jgi:hypothetical protein
MSYLLDTSIATLREDKSERNVAFFNKDNLDRLHCAIIKRVKNKGYNITKQSDIHLTTIMQYIYNMYERNYYSLEKMNNMVLDIVIPMIISNVKQHIQWNKDRQLLPWKSTMERGEVTSIKGNNIVDRKDIF